MEQDNASTPSVHAHVVGTKSWIAYCGTLVLGALLFFVLLPAAFLWNEIAAGVVLVVSALVVGYRLLLRSVQLYYDDVGVWACGRMGVWAYGGILP